MGSEVFILEKITLALPDSPHILFKKDLRFMEVQGFSEIKLYVIAIARNRKLLLSLINLQSFLCLLWQKELQTGCFSQTRLTQTPLAERFEMKGRHLCICVCSQQKKKSSKRSKS